MFDAGLMLRIEDFNLEKSMFFIKVYFKDWDFFSIFYCYFVSIFNIIVGFFDSFLLLPVFFFYYL